MDRRKFVSLFIKGTGTIIAAVLSVPLVLHSLTPNLKKDKNDDWKPLGPISNYPEGKIIPALVRVADDAGTLNMKSVYVWRKLQEDFVVYSRSCTDLGCPLRYDSG